MKTAYLSGVWDLLHAGHHALLGRSLEWADQIVVGVLMDSEANLREGKEPAQNEQERLAVIRSLPFVCDAFLYHTENDGRYSPEIDAAHERRAFDLLIHGDDFIPSEYMGMGLPILLLPYTQGVSSSQLRECRA